MKKFLVLAAVVVLYATPSLAAIANSKHDLSSGSTATIKGGSNEICVYCHTPHGAAAVGTAPLWNRTTVNATAFYNNPAGSMNSAQTLAGVNASDAILCLSCHDGVSLTGTLKNPPNSGGGNPAVNITGNGSLGTDLSNDHPVGFVYSLAATPNDLEIKAAPSVAAVKVTYGASGNQMWCSSCHDVHNGAVVPFLVTSNSASALCLACHLK